MMASSRRMRILRLSIAMMPRLSSSLSVRIAVFDDTMEDQLRVTVVATGLGTKVARQPKIVYSEGRGQRTGTYDLPPTSPSAVAAEPAAGVMNIAGSNTSAGSLDDFFTPNPRGGRDSRARDMSDTGMDKYDIPAFLRKQAD